MTRIFLCLLIGMYLSHLMAQEPISAFIHSRGWQHLPTEQKKVEAIYQWITNTIQYQQPDMADLDPSQFMTVAERTFDKKFGNCFGYASLLLAMCEILDIQAHLVQGRARHSPGDSAIGHAWVCVRTEQGWFHTDPTWDAGNVRDGVFIASPQKDYFAPSVDRFLLTHYPFDPAYQLISHPIRWRDFISQKQKGPKYIPFRQILAQEPFDRFAQVKRQYEYGKELPMAGYQLAEQYVNKANDMIHPILKRYNNMQLVLASSSDTLRVVEQYLTKAISLYKEEAELTHIQSNISLNLKVCEKNVKTVHALQHIISQDATAE